MATLATPQTDRDAIAAFRRDVIEASMKTLVLVDFWAEWCGPCKTLGPILERVTASYQGRVKLVKIDIDKNQLIAQQFRIQSVPTVYAFLGGQPVDGFAGAVAERELKAFIDRLLTAAPPGQEEAEDLTPLVEAGQAALADGAYDDAVQIFQALTDSAPDRPEIAAGLARALLGAGRVDEAEAALTGLPDAAAKDPAVAQARAAIALARDAGPADELASLKAAADSDPENMDKAFAYANAAVAAGDRDAAADTLLAMIARDRGWNDAAARTRLLQLFEAQGLADPWTANQRRRLSAILFA